MQTFRIRSRVKTNGIYFVQADGAFAANFGPTGVADDDGTVGFRGPVQTLPAFTAGLGFTDLIEVKGGLRVTGVSWSPAEGLIT